MKLRNSQDGMTILGMLVLLMLIGFAALVVMKLVPMYLESFKVDQALESMSKDSGLIQSTRSDIQKKFLRRMEVEDVDRFTQNNIKDYMTVEKKAGLVKIAIKYQGKASLFGNLSLVADFDKQTMIR